MLRLERPPLAHAAVGLGAQARCLAGLLAKRDKGSDNNAAVGLGLWGVGGACRKQRRTHAETAFNRIWQGILPTSLQLHYVM